MITVREQVFESNSSSCHSLTFSSSKSILLPQYRTLQWIGGDFGWEQKEYRDPQSKFSYWLVAFCIYISWLQEETERKCRNSQYYCITDNPEYWDAYNGPSSFEAYKVASMLFQQTILGVLKFFTDRGVTFTFAQESVDDFIQNVHELSDESSFRKGYTVLDSDYGGYIDHQSCPIESKECETLAKMKPQEVFEWVFGDGYIVTDNDNH